MIVSAWPHQTQAIDDVKAAIRAGCRRICLTCPTGGGKTLIMQGLASWWLAQGEQVALYTNRRLLMEQLSGSFDLAGLPHGIRAAGYEPNSSKALQIASIATEHSRTIKKKTWTLHDAAGVIVDEGHLQNNDTAREILEQHWLSGAAYVLFTATPLGMANMADTLIIAGTTSQLRECRALVWAHHYGPDEPDMKAFKALREGEDLSEEQVRKAIMRPGLWGRVLDYFGRINPDRRPSILFAPGVPESIWFAQQFCDAGIPAAHIDGDAVWMDGALQASNPQLREDVLAMSRAGKIKVLCNRFVLREGIDAPWLEHGVFATIFGSVQSYLQSGGRLMRSAPGFDHVTIQDHGGNWWRHGSLNEDREWRLEWDNKDVYDRRADSLRWKRCRKCGEPMLSGVLCAACKALSPPEPLACPICSRIICGAVCPCGYSGSKRARKVVMADGTLKEMQGAIFKPRRICTRPDGPKLWEKMYWRSRTQKGRRTFRAAMALFAAENNWGWPDPSWPLMPKNPDDWSRYVADVAREDLT